MDILRYLETATLALIVGCGHASLHDRVAANQATQDASPNRPVQVGSDKNPIENSPEKTSTADPKTGETETDANSSSHTVLTGPPCPIEASTVKPSSFILAQSGVAKEGTNPNAIFSVSLDLPAVKPVCVTFRTRDGSAKAPGRYQALTGVLVFMPGDLTKTVSIPLVDDNLEQKTQSFFVDLSNPVNGTILVAAGVVSIADNDYPGPSTLSVPDVVGKRGLNGTRMLTFVLTLDKPVDHDISFQYVTRDITAKAGIDYDAASGTVVFKARELSEKIDVPIYGSKGLGPDVLFSLSVIPNAEVITLRSVGAGIIQFGN